MASSDPAGPVGTTQGTGEGGADLSTEGVQLVAAAYCLAARRGHTVVGTEHLLSAILDSETTQISAALGTGSRWRASVQGLILAREDSSWVHADDGTDAVRAQGAGRGGAVAREPGADEPGLREAEWRARVALPQGLKAVPLRPSGAVRLTAQLAMGHARAGSAGAGGVHLALALLTDPGNRACEALVYAGSDLAAARTTLFRALEVAPPGPVPEGVALLRDGGLLDRRGRFGTRLLMRALGHGSGLQSAVLFVVRREARRQAVRCGRSRVEMVDLVLAVLALDEQLTAHGVPLPAETAVVNGGARALRAGGATHAVLARAAITRFERSVTAVVPFSDDVERALPAAKLVAVRWGDQQVGTTHLLAHLLDNPEGPPARLLADTGCDLGRVLAELTPELS